MSGKKKPSDELLSILVCPLCHVKVEQAGDELRCPRCERTYPIRDGIPDMVVEVEPDAQEER